MRNDRVVIIGGGIGGLAAAVALASHGISAHVVEAHDHVGGKIRRVDIAGARAADGAIDTGPTVLTMRWLFEELFEEAGTSLEARVRLKPLEVLARHSWGTPEYLDLFADVQRSADAIGRFAGAAEARGYLQFCERSARIYARLKDTFICQPEPRLDKLALSFAFNPGALWDISPYTSMWSSLRSFFRDPRLLQLFGRYATYCGSSPFEAPATLMLVAHVEQAGVWSIEGGISQLARTVADLAQELGATVTTGTRVAEILVDHGRACGVRLDDGQILRADAVIYNGDASALGHGLLGGDVRHIAPACAKSDRSLSAMTWAFNARVSGAALSRHNVFFSSDYAREFDDLLERRMLPRDPTVYVCAQSRSGGILEHIDGDEDLMCLVNAPADAQTFAPQEIETCRQSVVRQLEAAGLAIEAPAEWTLTGSPHIFETLFPGTGGALYGQATHGWSASFSRPGNRTKIDGLYLAGGSFHPGPGVPMAALSGRMAAEQLIADLASRKKYHRVGMRGGIWTR